MTTTKQEMHESLLGELQASLKATIRYYEGMLEELEQGSYNTNTARHDYDSLICSEDVNIPAILAEIVTLDKEGR